MGMYTEVEGWARLKEPFRAHTEDSVWVKCLLDGSPELKKKIEDLLRLPRADTIRMSFAAAERSEQGSYWEVSVSLYLKNYDGVVEKFIDEILPEIADDWNLQVEHDEWSEPLKATRADGYHPEEAKIDW